MVATYADLYREAEDGEEPLPPLDVFTIQGTYAVADGFHRLRAAHTANLLTIHCHVYQGSLRDAMVHAALANVQRGLPYTLGDKERVITRLLEDAEYAGRSDRALAKRLGMHHSYVSRLRKRLEVKGRLDALVSTVDTEQPATTPLARLAALTHVPQETIQRTLHPAYEKPEDLLDRMVRRIADDGIEAMAAIEQVASRFRGEGPTAPDAPWSRWPKRPSAAQQREKRGEAQREERARRLLRPFLFFAEELDEVVLPLERMRELLDDDTYERPADVPTLAEVLTAVDETGKLDELADHLSRAREVLATIAVAMVAYQQQHAAV